MERGAWGITVHGGLQRVRWDLVSKQQQYTTSTAFLVFLSYSPYFTCPLPVLKDRQGLCLILLVLPGPVPICGTQWTKVGNGQIKNES